MCLSCGCVLEGGSPTDDHDNDANLTQADLAAAAGASGISLVDAARNILDAVLRLQVPSEDGTGEVDVVLKALDAGAPQRFVLGVAYPANRVDGHGEYMRPAELERAAWDYARNHRQIGFYHADGTLGHADVVESYIWRGPDWQTTDISGQEQVIKSGDWVLGAILDEPGFALVTSRKADGWSVDGAARRRRTSPPRAA